VAFAQHRQQVVDHAANMRDVDLDVDVGRRMRSQHDVIRLGGVLHGPGELQPAALDHASEHVLGAGLRERHPACRELVQHLLLALYANRAQSAIRERQREGKTDPAEADDGNARFHERQSICARSGTGAQTPARSAD
jgi:hypothetical protein